MTQPLPFRGEESAMDPKPCITYEVRPCQSISNGVRNGWLCSVKQNQFCRFKVDAHAEECFFDKVKTGTKMGLMFEVAEGGFLDIDVRIEGPDGKVVHQVGVRQPWSLSDELDLWNGRESNRGSPELMAFVFKTRTTQQLGHLSILVDMLASWSIQLLLTHVGIA